jgi:hypothetical protein
MNERSDAPALQVVTGHGRSKDNVHHDYLLGKLPSPLKDAPVSRLFTMADSTVEFAQWYLNARAIDRQYLKQLTDERWRVQVPLDDALENVQRDICRTVAR